MFYHASRSKIASAAVSTGRIIQANGTTAGQAQHAANAAAFPIGFSSMDESQMPGTPGYTAGLAAASGRSFRIQGVGEEGMIQLGGTVAANARVSAMSDGTGRAVAFTATDGGQWIAGYVLEGGVAGDYVRFVFQPHPIAENVT